MKKIYTMLLLVFAIITLVGITVFADGNRTKIEGNTFIEIEDYNIMRQPMTIYKDETASGGAYISTTVGSYQMNSPKRDYEHLAYDITVPDTDSYFVWLRIRISMMVFTKIRRKTVMPKKILTSGHGVLWTSIGLRRGTIL